MPRLIATNGPLVGRRYEIDGELVLGERDAAVKLIGGGLRLEDLESADGTFVDGERIAEPVILRDGAEIRVGETTFIVEIDADGVDRNRTQTMIPTLALPPLAVRSDSQPPASPYAAPAISRRRRADTRMWLPAAVTFAAIVATAVALMLYFALR